MEPTPHDAGDPAPGRIESHGRGVGVPTPGMVERRARQIARINGRRVTAEDRVQAERELRDETVETSRDESRSDVVATRNPADMAVETGHEVKPLREPDEQGLAELETQEGVDEAEHEQMLKGQRIGEEKEE